MKKHTFKRIAAGLAAFAMLAVGVPTVQFSASAADLISNGTFESGIQDWGMYKESGGAGTLSADGGRLALKVTNTGKLNYSVQMFYDIIPLYQNGVYRLSYEISSTIDRFCEGMIQQNGGTYQAYTWKGLDLTSTPQRVSYEFTMEEETDIMAKLVFNCGTPEKSDPLPEHTIYLDNVSLELIDDSKVDYAASRPYQANILTNQVGYTTNAAKTAVFRNLSGQSEFSVVNAATKEVVYTGKLSSDINNSTAGETNKTGDFSSVTAPGKYYISCNGLDNSYTFEIGANPYASLLDDSVKMLYLQRCGTAVQDATFGHPSCHDSMATIYHTNEKIDVSGGWHDAGDYGRYVVAGAKAVADILYAYLANPSLFSGVNVLDEAKYELDWMQKMQASNGGVYHKVTCESFPGYVMPEAETKELIVTPISTTATADFCASMALAYEVYKSSDAAYANKCLAAAEKAWSFLEQNPNLIFQNPADITTGDYGDKSDKDERYWAAAQMYRATGDSKYANAISGTQTGLDWSTVGDYGNIALVTMKGADAALVEKAKSAIVSQADKLKNVSSGQAYGVAITKYEWGSNMTIANAGIIMGLAYQLTGDASYLKGASAQLDYLLGTNPLGTCFVSGYGTVSPQNPHHRPSMAQGKAMKGMLAGGVNQNLEDSAAKAYCNGLAPALCYVDNSESYSTNEITIYWNSPLTYLLSVLEADPAQPPVEQPTNPPQVDPTENQTPGDQPGNVKYGDVNVDGNVDLVDVILLNKHIMVGANVSDQGKINGDVDRNNNLDEVDSLNILKSIVRIVTLPVGDAPVQQPTQPQQPTEAPTQPQQPTEAPQPTDPPQPSNGITDFGTPMNASASFVSDFRTGKANGFFASDGWTNGDPFNCWWYQENTALANGCLSLSIDQDKGGKGMYSGAEYRTEDFYGYGYYETSMQAIKNPGVVSSFFTYTGPSDDNPWDEIDIEILGKDTTKVQLNYYTNGVGNHEFMYDLGFDSSEGFHTYGFDWQRDHITWYVDGKAVYTAYDNIPVTPGKIMMNTWPGKGVDEWLAPYNGNTPLTARYQWVTYNK